MRCNIYKLYNASQPDSFYIGFSKYTLARIITETKRNCVRFPERELSKAINLDELVVEILECVQVATRVESAQLCQKYKDELHPSLGAGKKSHRTAEQKREYHKMKDEEQRPNRVGELDWDDEKYDSLDYYERNCRDLQFEEESDWACNQRLSAYMVY